MEKLLHIDYSHLWGIYTNIKSKSAGDKRCLPCLDYDYVQGHTFTE